MREIHANLNTYIHKDHCATCSIKHFTANILRDSINQNAKFPRCEIPNTVGSHPLEACSLMEKLKKDREAMKDDKYILSRRKCDDYDNIIILEGENGTGKKFLLRHILFAAHCY